MQHTVDLPEDLEIRVTEYLRENPQLTFSRLVQECLEAKLGLKDLSPLLNLAGVVTRSQSSTLGNVEDDVVFDNCC